jgi:hypothetical protein
MQGREDEMTFETRQDGQAPPALQPLEPGPPDAPRPAGGGRLRRIRIAGRPEPRPATTAWARTWQWVLAAAVTVLLAWLTYSRGGWIQVLSAFDLGVHEFGHLLTAWAPALMCQFAGSFLQVALPLLFCAYFWWRRDQLAVILTLAWAAENLHNVSVYIADSQVMILPLFGDDGSGAGHDWHNILTTLGLLQATDQIALLVKTASIIVFIVALGLAVLGFSSARRA